MKFRAEQLGGEDQADATEADDDYDDYDDEAVAVPRSPPPRGSLPGKQLADVDSLLAGGPSEWFGSWWRKRADLLPQFREALVNFRPIQIRNFLAPGAALALHQELYDSNDYEVYESYHRSVLSTAVKSSL
jgi:hypothetical protein